MMAIFSKQFSDAYSGRPSATLGTDNYAYHFDNIGNRMISAENGTDRNYAANQLNQYTEISNPTFNPSYDDDGNGLTVRTGTGAWTIEYNAENRPVTFTNGTTIIECKYDSQGHRFEKKVTVNGTVTFWQRYAYRGYLQIAAFNVTLDAETEAEVYTLATTTMWDPMEQTATRPLAFTDHTAATPATYFYTHDLTKNVCELLNASGATVTTYDYTPFGAVTASNSATPNTFMFSSEVYDPETALVYYNYRHYNPLDGRWINRDPIGGKTLSVFDYLFTHNKSLVYFDHLGQNPVAGTWDAGTQALQSAPPQAKPVVVVALVAIGIAWLGYEIYDYFTDDETESGSAEKTDAIPVSTTQKKQCCAPCIPPVGTIAYKIHVPPSKPHAGMIKHVHLFKMNQSPYPHCKCFWQRDYIDPVPGEVPPVGTIPVTPAGGGGPLL